MICPSVMSWAMPRPATRRSSVAMIGWIPKTATSTPFQARSTIESPERERDRDQDAAGAVLVVLPC